MKLTAQQYAQALYDAVSETAHKDHDKVIENFLKILRQNGDLEKHSQIEEAYKILDAKAKGISQAEVTTAQKIELNSGLVKELNEIAKGKLEIKQKVDEGLVGGIVMKVDDTLLDASVKTQLEDLKETLSN